MVTTVTPSKQVNVVTRKLIPLKRLRNAPHNPANRIRREHLKELMDSMDLIGLLHPVSVSSGDVIIDGHRRVASAKALGWQDIECNIITEDADTVYASVNGGAARRMSGNDSLCVWLANRRAIGTTLAARFGEMEKEIGRPLVRKIADAGLSARVYQTGKRVCRYCDDSDPATLRSVVSWLLDTATVGQVMKALESGASPKVILEAVRRNKPVVFKLAIGE